MQMDSDSEKEEIRACSRHLVKSDGIRRDMILPCSRLYSEVGIAGETGPTCVSCLDKSDGTTDMLRYCTLFPTKYSLMVYGETDPTLFPPV